MAFVKLALVFVIIIALLACKRPLWQAILGGLAATAVFYQILPLDMVRLTGKVVTSWSSISVLLSLYLITFLQRILEARSQIRLAQEDLNGLFHNRRINIIGACLFIGLLPSAASMLLCAELVKNATDGYLDSKEQAFVSSWFRHIPESVLPTYTAVLLMLSLSGVETAKFMVGMIPPVLFLGMLGYFVYLRRVPTTVDTPKSSDRFSDLLHLLGHLWSLILILVLILAFHFEVVTAVLPRYGHQRFYCRHRYGHPSGLRCHLRWCSSDGLSHVHGTRCKPALSYPCLPGRGIGLFSYYTG